VYLGRKRLAVAGNDRSTVFSGHPCWTVALSKRRGRRLVTQDRQRLQLTLTGVNNTYTGATAVDGGTLAWTLRSCRPGLGRSNYAGARPAATDRWQHGD